MRLSVDRLDNEKGYEEGNLGLACMRCNAVKSNIFTHDEMKRIGNILKNKRE